LCLIIAAAVTGTELLMQAYAYELYQILGIFLPLITTNCVILGRADAFAAKNPLMPALADGVMMGLGFGLVLVVLGAIRELLGTGAVMANMDLLLGPMAKDWVFVVASDYTGLLLAILPPGAFIITGLLIAAKNVIDARIEKANKAQVEVQTGSKRVRVTGEIA
jgi:electron transport complex protein RnfE